VNGQRIAVVGHCAAGKSTVVRLLADRGFEAYSVAQEHSSVHDLWNHQQPDFVLYLDVSLEEMRRRRDNPDWPEWIFEKQSQRLRHAREHAALVIDTDRNDPEAIVALVERHVGGE
jgi:deoxyadenosine/deoxycytidine kinase